MKTINALIMAVMMSGVSALTLTGASWHYPDEMTQELPYEEGMGTQESPYIIANAQQLANLAYYVNNGSSYEGVYFKLGNDIDLNPEVQFNADFTYTSADNIEPQQWIPIGIGSRGQYFAGNFDGNGHKITGLYPKVVKGEWYDKFVSSNDAYYFSGLFGVVYESVISNLVIDNSLLVVDGTKLNECFEGNMMHIGLLAGCIRSGKVIDCKNYGHILAEKTSSTLLGGLVGSIISGDIQNCENHGNITDRGVPVPELAYYNANCIGGIVGDANGGVYCNLLNTGRLGNEQEVIDGRYGAANSCGGIAYSLSSDGRICKLENRGDILNGSGVAVYIKGDTLSLFCNKGDVVNGSGVALEACANVLTECYNSGCVSADASYDANIAGLVGIVYYFSLHEIHHIENCWNTGTVTHERASVAGLFAELDNNSAFDGNIENDWVVEKSFNIGTVTTKGGDAAGLMVCGPQSLYDCYNAGILSGDDTYGLCDYVKELRRCFNYEQKNYTGTVSPNGEYVGDFVFGSWCSNFDRVYYLTFPDAPAGETMMMGKAMTAEEFAVGTVLTALSDGQEASPWYQNGSDRYPKLNDVDDTFSAVDSPVVDVKADDGRIYDLLGRYVGTDKTVLKAGIYIINGRKVLIR